MTKPHILIINDDGINTPGIRALYEAVKGFGKITIVAPASQRSGAGLSLTLHGPIQADPYPWHDEGITAYAVKGTPVDCVKFATNLLLEKKPDMILSGINPQINSGRNVLYSGTIGAVIEGTHQNIPGIAFSIEDELFPSNFPANQEILTLVEYFLEHPMEMGSFLNVSFPHTEKLPYKGMKMASQGKSITIDDPKNITIDNGQHRFFLGGKWLHFDEPEDTDIALLKNGYSAIVPIHVHNMTDHAMIQKHQIPLEKKLSTLPFLPLKRN